MSIYKLTEKFYNPRHCIHLHLVKSTYIIQYLHKLKETCYRHLQLLTIIHSFTLPIE